MGARKSISSLKKWGNSLAIRIPASFARTAHFHLGSQVELSIENESIVVKSIEKEKMTLQDRLNLFDPAKHGGEVMASERIGLEQF